MIETETAAVATVRCGCAHPHRLADVSELGGVHVRATIGRRRDASLHVEYVIDLATGRMLIHCPHSHQWSQWSYDHTTQRVEHTARTTGPFPRIGCPRCDAGSPQHRAPTPGP